jgi:ribulose-phosphate 3-epimerase
MPHLVAPSILSANFGNLDADIEMLNNSSADWFHIDIMDGVFVPNISFGFPVLEAVSKKSKKPLDVHLMIINPGKYIEHFARAGASVITVHYEATNHLHSMIHQIRSMGIKAGVSLNPHSPVNLLEEILPDLDLVLLMTVNPGFGGQDFIPGSYNKVKKLRTLINETGSSALIEVDGGVDLANASLLVEAGVDVLVAGSAVFKSLNPRETIDSLKKCHNKFA